MKITPAFLVQEYSEEEKKKLQLVGAFYSLTHKGWFLSQEQKDKLEKSETDPSVLPTPTIATAKGIGIFIDDLVDVWKITGETFAKKDAIKQLGARWSGVDKSWRVPKEKASREDLERALQ